MTVRLTNDSRSCDIATHLLVMSASSSLVMPGVEAQLARAVEQPVEVVAEPEDVAVPHVCDGVGEVGVAEAGVEDRDPGVLGGHVLALDPGHAAGEGAGGVELVVAVLDHRAGGGVLADGGAGLDGDEVAGAEVGVVVMMFLSEFVVRVQISGDVGLGEVGSGFAGGQPLAQAGDRPDAGQHHEAEEDLAVAGELRQEDQRRAHQR